MLTLVLSLCAVPQRGLSQVLQPETHASPDGRWKLNIEPEDPSGIRGASYSMKLGEEIVWQAQHPFALWEAVVADDGAVLGYAYRGRSREAGSGGEFCVAILAPTGEVRLEEEHERESSAFMHTSGNPLAAGVLLLPGLGRAVVRVVDADINRGAEEWWIYDLASGKELERVRPKERLALDEALRSLLAARAVPGTPLVLLQWYRFYHDSKPWQLGTVFQLVDPDWNVVWSLARPLDYTRDDEAEQDRLREEIWEQGAVLATSAARFELRFAAGEERVTFGVERVGTDWRVSELARAPYERPAEPEAALPKRALAPKRRIALGQPLVDGREVRDIFAFGFDERSRLRFARREGDGGAFTLIQLDEQGTVARATPVAPFECEGQRDDRGWEWFPLPGRRWLEACETFDDEPARLRLVHESDGAARTVPGFSGTDVERIAALGEDSFVVLGTWSSRYTMTSGLVAFDLDGHELWHVEESFEDEQKLFNPEDVAVTSDGHVVVLDNTRKRLQFYSGAGKFLRNVELTEVLGAEPNYPSGLCAGPQGSLLLYDFNGVPPLHRLSRADALLGSFEVRRADGTALSEYSRNAQVAPDGRLWTTDGSQFLRVDEGGVVDLELGAPENVGELADPGFACIDSSAGRVLVHDQRSRAVHVFDGQGRRVTLCRPAPEEREKLRFPMALAVAPDGSVFVADSRFDRSALRFEPDGSSAGEANLKVRDIVFAPGAGEYFGVSQRRVERLDPAGKELMRLERLSDGNWFRSIEDLAVASDGSLAVLDSPPTDGIRRASGASVVALFDPSGKPRKTFAIPAACAAVGLAFQGERVLLWNWHDAWLLDARSGQVVALELPEPADAYGLSPDGRELWLVTEDKRTLLACPLGD